MLVIVKSPSMCVRSLHLTTLLNRDDAIARFQRIETTHQPLGSWKLIHSFHYVKCRLNVRFLTNYLCNIQAMKCQWARLKEKNHKQQNSCLILSVINSHIFFLVIFNRIKLFISHLSFSNQLILTSRLTEICSIVNECVNRIDISCNQQI